MKTKTAKVKAGAKVVAAIATVAGKKMVKKLGTRMAAARDAALIDVGNSIGKAAKQRKRARAAKTALKGLGGVVLVTGAAAATVMAGRAVMRRRKG